MRFKKRPVVVDATQWNKFGDHGKVDLFRDDTRDKCQYCKRIYGEHGWISTLEGGHIVCPGDWVITGIAGEHYPCKDAIFRATYEIVDDGA